MGRSVSVLLKTLNDSVSREEALDHGHSDTVLNVEFQCSVIDELSLLHLNLGVKGAIPFGQLGRVASGALVASLYVRSNLYRAEIVEAVMIDLDRREFKELLPARGNVYGSVVDDRSLCV